MAVLHMRQAGLGAISLTGASETVSTRHVQQAGKSAFLGRTCTPFLQSSRESQRRSVISCDVRRSQPGDWVGGNPEIQNLLVDMIRLETGAVRVNDFVAERSEFMKDIAAQAHKDYERIASRTMKGVDAAGSRVMRRLDLGAIQLEKELKESRAELEAQAIAFEEFEERIVIAKNEGLFFKQLYQPRKRGSVYKLSARRKQEQAQKAPVVALVDSEAPPASDESATFVLTPGYKQLLYGALSMVLVSFMWSSTSAFLAGTTLKWPKLLVYFGVFSTMLGQLACDSKAEAPDSEKAKKGDDDAL